MTVVSTADDERYRAIAALVDEGRLDDALASLDSLAAEQRDRADGAAESRTLRQSAALARGLGDTKGALRRARRAVAASSDDPDERSVALVELGECLLSIGDNMTAANAFADAMSQEGAAGFDDAGVIALLRKRAEALLAAGRADDAVDVLEDARSLAIDADDDESELRILVEIATALLTHRRPGWEHAVASAAELAALRGDDAAIADVAMLRASVALDDGDAPAALVAAEEAQAAALRGVIPASYVGATLTISLAADHVGDRVRAYASLATGWATLGDLLGPDAAREVFGPHLLELRHRWGADEFEQVKATHDDLRRQA